MNLNLIASPPTTALVHQLAKLLHSRTPVAGVEQIDNHISTLTAAPVLAMPSTETSPLTLKTMSNGADKAKEQYLENLRI